MHTEPTLPFLSFRNLFGGDVSRPVGVWWNDAGLAAEVNSVEQTLSTPRRESTTRQDEKTHRKRASVFEPQGLITANDKFPCLPATLVEETWDRFPTGVILAPNLELNQPSRPCTPPNLTRIIQVRHAFSSNSSSCFHLRIWCYSFIVVLLPSPLVEF